MTSQFRYILPLTLSLSQAFIDFLCYFLFFSHPCNKFPHIVLVEFFLTEFLENSRAEVLVHENLKKHGNLEKCTRKFLVPIKVHGKFLKK